jgi:hypothetical protein
MSFLNGNLGLVLFTQVSKCLVIPKECLLFTIQLNFVVPIN